MDDRVALCNKPGAVCPPVAHTMSNRMMDLAPTILQWWYSKATPSDTFVLGPSGACRHNHALSLDTNGRRHVCVSLARRDCLQASATPTQR